MEKLIIKIDKMFEQLNTSFDMFNRELETFLYDEPSHIKNSDDNIKFSLILPGRNKENTVIKIEDKRFIVETKAYDKPNRVIQSIPLKTLVDEDKYEKLIFDAEFKDGVLNVEIKGELKKPKESNYTINLK